MKTISFYNEKGGVGKTTFTILYASFLKYKHGIDVAVLDLNNRISIYRKDEIANKKAMDILDRYDMDSAWPIIQPAKEELQKFKGQKMPLSNWLNEKILDGQFNDCQVLLVDLPGAAPTKEFGQMIFGKHINLYVIPTDRNAMTVRSTMAVYHAIDTYAGEPKPTVAAFINQIQTYISPKEYERVAQILKNVKLQLLPDMISFSERLKTLNRENIIVSTLEYPNWSDKAFEGSKDLGIENLFIDVTKLLSETEDHENTKKANLTFCYGLHKEFREDRQLIHSSFPKFDFPETLFKSPR